MGSQHFPIACISTNKETAFMRYFIFSILIIAVSLSTPLSAQQEEQGF